MEERREFFNKIALEWENEIPECEKLERVVERAKIEEGNIILDAGAGTGVLIPFLLKKVGRKGKIYAIDYAEKMVEIMKSKNFPENVVVLHSDIHKTTFRENFFDRIIANASFPHFQNKKKALEEIHRILKKNGLFIISHPAGRKKVNEIHRKVHPSVRKDIIPDMKTLIKMVEREGFKFSHGIDEKDFFLLSFCKREPCCVK
ncbi:class I SAM-dependent methyltransferase [bacterium]|nr:class I SAM-dependent methyltransferase [bacterium]